MLRPVTRSSVVWRAVIGAVINSMQSSSKRSADDREQTMGAGDRQRAVAHGESDTLGGSGADVPGGQHAG